MRKRPGLLNGFQGKVLKATFRVRVAACGLCPDWLVVRQQGDVSRILTINLLDPSRLGSMCLWSACSHHTPPEQGGCLGFCTPTQRYVSDCYVQPLRRNQDSVFFVVVVVFIQQALISYPFYTYQCIYVNPNLPVHPTTTPHHHHFPRLGVHTFVLYNCVSISALQTSSSVPFFQIPHI